MKYFLSACFFFCITTQMVYAQKCVEQEECAEGKCCSGVPPFGGFCMDLTVEGGKCKLVEKTVPIFGDFVIGPCPCAEGLTCVHTEGKKANDGTCQLPPTTETPAVDADDTAEEPAADDTAEEPAADDTPAEEPSAEAGDSSASDSAAVAE